MITEQNFNCRQINYRRLSDVISASEQRLRTHYYDRARYQSNPPSAQEKERGGAKAKLIRTVINSVQRFWLRHERLIKTGQRTYEQERINMLLGADMVRLCSKKQIDLVILIAGDADLVPAVEACKAEGATVRLYYHRSAVSDELLNIADERREIDTALITKVLSTAGASGSSH